MSELAGNGLPTHHIVFCDECRQARTFSSKEAGEAWKAHHPHLEGGLLQ
jgi:hypothetical protein